MSQPFEGQGTLRKDTPVTCQILEDRINVYISAMDRAMSMNDTSMSSQLQRDIQQLVDLMEKVQIGQPVTEKDVPPPLVMTPMNDVLANPLGELSSRLSDYHKALYFAEEELSDGRITKIQNLQKGLQTIHNLQKRAQAGFPIRDDEVPPPVTIPSDNEFDNNAVKTVTERLEQYNSILKTCQESSGPDRRRISKIQSGIRTLEFLLTRAKANRPVWRKDIPAEFEYFSTNIDDSDAGKLNKAKTTIQLQSLITRVSKVKCERQEQQSVSQELYQKLQGLVQSMSSTSSPHKIDVQSLVHQVEALEMMTDTKEKEGKGSVSAQNNPEEFALIVTRMKEYLAAAMKAKREEQVNNAIKHLKVFKGLKSMKEMLEKGGSVDMTLVPPPPREDTPIAESLPPLPTDSNPGQAVTAHAQVTDVDTKSTVVESNKSKLARKLASYLEVDNDVLSANSSSTSSIDSDSIPSPCEGVSGYDHVSKPLPAPGGNSSPVANHSSPVSKASPQSSPQKVSLSNIGLVGCDNHSSTEDFNPSLNMVSNIDSGVNNSPLKSKSIQSSSPIRVIQRNDHNFTDTKGGNDQHMYKTNPSLQSMDKGVTTETATSVPARTNEPTKPKQESNSSRPLDSIGFLSCQEVPSFSAASGHEQSSHSISTANSSDSCLTLEKANLSFESVPSSFNGTTNATQSSSEKNISFTDIKTFEQSYQSEKQNNEYIYPQYVNEKDTTKSDTTGFDPSNVAILTLNHTERESTDNDQTLSPASVSNQAVRQELLSDPASSFLTTDITVPEVKSESNSNQSNSALLTESNWSMNGHEPQETMSVPHTVNSSSSREAHAKDDVHSGKNILETNSDINPSTDFVHLKNHNVDVNILNNDSLVRANNNHGNVECPAHNMVSHGEEEVTKDTGSISGVKMNVQNNTTDAEEFEDLMNSMSVSGTSGDILRPLKAPTEESEQGQPLHQKNNPKNGRLSDEENLKWNQNYETFSKQESNVTNLETSDSTFHSLPENVSTSSLIPNSSELGLDPSRGKSLDAINNSSSSLALNKSNIRTLIPDTRHNMIPPSQQFSLMTSNAHQSLQPTSANLPGGSLLQSANPFTGRNGIHDPPSGVNSNSSPFTCLETLKYDILVTQAKNSEESQKESDKLGREMEVIKDKLRQGGRKVWEEYKNRVEYELQVLNNGVKQCGETHNWEEYKYLNRKRMLNERELALLNQRICEIQD